MAGTPGVPDAIGGLIVELPWGDPDGIAEQLRGRERGIEEFGQPEQRGGGIPAATTEAGGHGDALFQMDADAVRNAGGREKGRRGAMHEVGGIHGERGIAAGERHARAGGLERQLVAQPDRVHDGFEFVKTVGAAAEDVEEEVDFAGGGTGQHNMKKAPTRKCRRPGGSGWISDRTRGSDCRE